MKRFVSCSFALYLLLLFSVTTGGAQSDSEWGKDYGPISFNTSGDRLALAKGKMLCIYKSFAPSKPIKQVKFPEEIHELLWRPLAGSSLFYIRLKDGINLFYSLADNKVLYSWRDERRLEVLPGRRSAWHPTKPWVAMANGYIMTTTGVKSSVARNSISPGWSRNGNFVLADVGKVAVVPAKTPLDGFEAAKIGNWYLRAMTTSPFPGERYPQMLAWCGPNESNYELNIGILNTETGVSVKLDAIPIGQVSAPPVLWLNTFDDPREVATLAVGWQDNYAKTYLYYLDYEYGDGGQLMFKKSDFRLVDGYPVASAPKRGVGVLRVGNKLGVYGRNLQTLYGIIDEEL